ncbi:hypothetical protein HF324_18540 [Chitinophaga oryzae]|uniref:Uncharacterized protein n=1 Tax=Chitinophaga oryzae TaxID=2725414 RepID=A0ABX6LHZ2_9BACT|nr:hypothetical protein [Chitinophaga oryzae]QJB39748.1 hypothetical protein HF324_18540 [Chitinophaga oryzae]
MNRSIKQISAIGTITQLCLEIQNKGIGTAFVEFTGHTGTLFGRFYVPQWKGGAQAEHTFQLQFDEKHYDPQPVILLITNLQDVVITGVFPKDFNHVNVSAG